MLKIITPILLLVGAFFLGKYLIATGPEPKKRASSERVQVVEVMPLKSEDYTVVINASGIVKAGVQSNLVSEASGKIIRISNDFQEGAYFNKNSILAEIDKESYINAVSIAESDVAANRASLKQVIEEQKSSLRSVHLANKNLQLGKKEANRLQGLWKKRLIARSLLDAEKQKTNQLEQKVQDLQGKQNTFKSRRLATQAKINASIARLKQEKLNLSRTIIKAPYTGRVLTKQVDVGQFVSKGTVLGSIYATDYVNIALPLSLKQYELLEMPESFRNRALTNSSNASTKKFPKVTFSASGSNRNATWQGKIVRSSAALDADSRQINVIAQIDNPFDYQNNAKEGASVPLRMGQYLKARIKGKTFNKVFVLPPATVRHNKEILLLQNGVVTIVAVTVLWNASDASVVVLNKKSEKAHTDEAKIDQIFSLEGKQLITTTLSQAVQGMKVITLEQQRLKNKKATKKTEPLSKGQPASD